MIIFEWKKLKLMLTDKKKIKIANDRGKQE